MDTYRHITPDLPRSCCSFLALFCCTKHCCLKLFKGATITVLPEIFARVLFSLNFAVGVGPHKLSARIFLRTRKFDLMEFITTCRRCDFLDAVELLRCSSFSFLDKLLRVSLLRYLQPVSNKCQGPKWACLTYCTHTESTYLTAKLASSNLPFVSDQFVKRIHISFRDTKFSRCINFALTAHPRNLDARIISLIQRL